jgi:hypothetical protein
MRERIVADMAGRTCLVICDTLDSEGNVVTNADCFASEKWSRW